MAIIYTEKGAGLHQAIAAAGHWLVQHDGQWTSSDDQAVQAIIDAFDPLPPAKAEKWAQIQAERDRRKHGGYLTAGKRFHSDPDSRIQQLGLRMMGAAVPPVPWKTMDGSYITMTPEIAAGIFAATAQADIAIFGAAETHRAAVNALGTLAAIEAYDFSTGWPVV